ncbi:hypothetical protein N8475_11145 [Winogradskyella sp.]|nr:hypothetical protein [Winogradskyella sp.]
MIKKSILGLLAIGFFAVSCSSDDDTAQVIMPEAGELSVGPYTFCIDGMPDMVSGITLNNPNAAGTNRGYVITDDLGNILGLPPTLDAVEGVDFEGAGSGVCLIWYLRYENGLEGLEVGMNASNLVGSFDLSNALTVTRNQPEAGTLSGGPFTFTVEGTPDMVSGISLDNPNASGAIGTYVITDDQGMILGVPPTLAAVEGVNFDGAGTGVCFIWYLRYEEGLQGLAMGMNTANLEGCFDLSNAIQVTRN